MTRSGKRIVLHSISEREADVYLHTPLGQWERGRELEDEKRIGRVYRHQNRNKGFSEAMGADIFLWCARDAFERNHGDTYVDKWSAAKQLALGLGFGEYAL